MPKIIEGLAEKIADAARTIMAKRGIAGVDMRSVAHEAGVAVGTVYNHYPDKESLLLAVLTSEYETFRCELALQLEPVHQKAERLVIVIEGLYSFVTERRGIWESFGAGQMSLPACSEEGWRQHMQVMKETIDLVAVELARPYPSEGAGDAGGQHAVGQHAVGRDADADEQGCAETCEASRDAGRRAAALVGALSWVIRVHPEDDVSNLKLLNELASFFA